MIKKVELTRFKKYKSQKFLLRPNGLTLLVGGNNSGNGDVKILSPTYYAPGPLPKLPKSLLKKLSNIFNKNLR